MPYRIRVIDVAKNSPPPGYTFGEITVTGSITSGYDRFWQRGDAARVKKPLIRTKRKRVNPIALALVLLYSLFLSACASAAQQLKSDTPAKMATQSSCDNPVIVQHPQLTPGYPEDLRAEESRLIYGSERIASLLAMGLDVVDYGGGHCDDPRIHKYKPNPSPSSVNKALEVSEKSSLNEGLSYTLYALHMTPWQINADPSVVCKTRYKHHYQPPLKLHGVGRVNMMPDGKQCQRTSILFSDISEALRIVLSFDGLVENVLDASIDCSGADDFETFQEYSKSISARYYRESPEGYDIAKTWYQLDRLRADVCKIYLDFGSFELLLTKIANSHDLLAESPCYDREQVLLDRKLSMVCMREASLVAKIYRVYAKSLAQSRGRIDEYDANIVTEIQKVNLAAKSRLSVYMKFETKYGYPTIDVHDVYYPTNSYSMTIRYISADAIYSIDQYLEGG